MNALHRNFGIPSAGPVYVPTSFGDKTICDLPLTAFPPRRKPRPRFWSRRAWMAVTIGVLALAIIIGVPLGRAWLAHTRALPIHTNCGETP